MPAINVDKALRLMLGAAHKLLKLGWFVRRPTSFGAHALALTPSGKVILVKLRYAPGWRLPGGGRKESEDPRDAALRELREEIGMVSHGSVEHACELEETADYKRDIAALFIVRDVRYRPKWSWEIEQICEAELNELPADLSPRMAGWLEALRPKL
jgi:8-oxo-dGTP pyrophosphatase MutT (NUDIX family)